MKTRKWVGYDFNQNGWSKTHENHSDAFDQFVRDFRSDLKTMVKGTDWVVLPFTGNWFSFSGFLYNEKLDKYWYFSISDVRYFQDSWHDAILYRTAKHAKDWTGGANRYCKFFDLIYSIQHAFGQEL